MADNSSFTILDVLRIRLESILDNAVVPQMALDSWIEFTDMFLDNATDNPIDELDSNEKTIFLAGVVTMASLFINHLSNVLDMDSIDDTMRKHLVEIILALTLASSVLVHRVDPEYAAAAADLAFSKLLGLD